jgi:hypothetical protein
MIFNISLSNMAHSYWLQNKTEKPSQFIDFSSKLVMTRIIYEYNNYDKIQISFFNNITYIVPHFLFKQFCTAWGWIFNINQNM